MSRTKKSLIEPVPPTSGHAAAEVLVQPVDHRLRPRARDRYATTGKSWTLEHLGAERGDDHHADARRPTSCAGRRPTPSALRPCCCDAFAGGDAVEGDRREHDAEAGRERPLGVELLQPGEHLAADIAGADLRGDHDDAERHHDHLVEAEQHRAAGQAGAAPC